MKLLVLATLLLAGTAQADTIELFTTPGFGNLHQYHNVSNSADAAVDFNLPQASNRMVGLLYLDGMRYDCPNLLAFPEQLALQATTCVDLERGATVYLTFAETWHRVLRRMGRLNQYVTYWALVAGTITK